MKKISTDHLDSMVSFVRSREAVCLIDRRKYEEMPPWLKKTGSVEDILDEIGTAIGNHGVNEMFVYSTPSDAQHGIAHMGSKPGYSDASIMAIKLPLAMILNFASKLGDSSLWINHGMTKGFQLYGGSVDDLKQVAILVRISLCKKVYIIETEDGRPMTRKAKTGNQYAIGFLSTEDAEYFIEDYQKDIPPSQYVACRPVALANDLLNSSLSGITLDYRLGSQLLLTRENLIDLIKIKNVIPNPLVEKVKTFLPANSF